MKRIVEAWSNREQPTTHLAHTSGRSVAIRSIAVAIFDALALLAILILVANSQWTLVVLLGLAALLVNWAYLNPRTNASRWLTPGLILMAFFVVYPVLYTGYVSFTNWQTGSVLTKQQVIENLEARQTLSSERSETGSLAVYQNSAEELALLVGGDTIDVFFGQLRPPDGEPQALPAEDIGGLNIDSDIDLASPPPEIGGYTLLSRLQVTGVASQLEGGVIDLPDGRTARIETLSTVVVNDSRQRFVYDEANDSVVDNQFGLTCASGEGAFYCNDVPQELVATIDLQRRDSVISCSADVCDNVPLYAIDGSLPGWRQFIGPDNYIDIFTSPTIRTPFLRVLIWNVAFALFSVLSTFALGLGLALALKDEGMKGRAIYRSIYILPYAIPAFLSVLIWRGLLNSDFGKVNGIIETFGLPGVDWLGRGSTAMIAVLVVNLWLGFPYMFLITSGALTAVPEDLLEAARVDGAGPWKSFRMITLPLLLVSTAPLLIGSFAFNFNNFILIFLLTDGGPPLSGYDVPVGSTDLLISFTFKLAQAAGRGAQFGLASAIVVLIFLVLATTSAFSFRLTKRLEEIYDQ